MKLFIMSISMVIAPNNDYNFLYVLHSSRFLIFAVLPLFSDLRIYFQNESR